MKITKKLLKDIIDTSYNLFIQSELENILSGISERNLCWRLAVYIENTVRSYGIVDYFADTEYNRKQNWALKTIIRNDLQIIENIQCDLILHSRGKYIKEDNLIAIEMKKSIRPHHEKVSDKNRLMALTKKNDIWSVDGTIEHPEHVCWYMYWIYMELDIKKRLWIFEIYEEWIITENIKKIF